MTTNMTDSVRSRVKFLRMALQEAVRAGDKEAVKRLTKRLFGILSAPNA
jgi:hypothetical protein